MFQAPQCGLRPGPASMPMIKSALAWTDQLIEGLCATEPRPCPASRSPPLHISIWLRDGFVDRWDGQTKLWFLPFLQLGVGSRPVTRPMIEGLRFRKSSPQCSVQWAPVARADDPVQQGDAPASEHRGSSASGGSFGSGSGRASGRTRLSFGDGFERVRWIGLRVRRWAQGDGPA